MSSLPNNNQPESSSQSSTSASTSSDRKREFPLDLTLRRRGRPRIAQDGAVILPPRYNHQQQTSVPPTMSSSGSGSGSGSGGVLYAGPRSVVLPTLTFPFPPVPLFQPSYEIDVSGLHFLFEKKLKPSDVNSQGRIILPKREAEACLPKLEDKDGIVIKMHDIDGLRAWTFRFRFWPNNESRMYLLENAVEFVKAYSLVIGDYAMFYIDRRSGFYYVRGRKVSDEVPKLEPTRVLVREAANPRVTFPRLSLDIEVNNHSHNVNFPTMEEEVKKPPFLYDTALSNDYLLVCTKLDPIPEIGSDESISFDDFL